MLKTISSIRLMITEIDRKPPYAVSLDALHRREPKLDQVSADHLASLIFAILIWWCDRPILFGAKMDQNHCAHNSCARILLSVCCSPVGSILPNRPRHGVEAPLSSGRIF